MERDKNRAHVQKCIVTKFFAEAQSYCPLVSWVTSVFLILIPFLKAGSSWILPVVIKKINELCSYF